MITLIKIQNVIGMLYENELRKLHLGDLILIILATLQSTEAFVFSSAV
jgi:hypothetical protein